MRQTVSWLVGAGARWTWERITWAWALALRGLGVLRRSGLRIVGAALLSAFFAGLAHFTVYLGPWGAAVVFFLGLGAAAAVGKGRQLGAGRLALMGGAILVTALPALGAVMVGARLAETHGEAHYLAGWALFFGVTFLGTSALVPLLEAAPRLALGGDLRSALAASLVAAGRRGLVRTLIVGAVAAGLVSLVPMLDVLGPTRLVGPIPAGRLPTVAALVGGTAVLAWSGLLTLSGALATEPPAPRARSRSAFAFVTAAIVLLVAATLAGATLLPVENGPLPSEPTSSAPPLDALIDHGVLTVRVGENVVRVPARPDERVRWTERADDGSTYLIVGAGSDRWALHLDEDGHRLDDGPLDRIAAHVGLEATVAFVLAALLVLAAVRRMRGRTRLFRAVRRGAESVLRGRLRAERDVPVEKGVARTVGLRLDAEDGTTMVALPPTIAVLGAEVTALTEGQELELVSPVPIERLGFRQGVASCPDGAALVLPGSARLDELVAGWALTPAAGWLASASVTATLGTVLMLGGAAWLRAASTADEVASMSTLAPMVDSSDRARADRVMGSAYAPDVRITSPLDAMVTARMVHVLFDELDVRLGAELVLPAIELGSVLDLLGFQTGDRVIAVAGIPVSNRSALLTVLDANRSSRALGVRVLRAGASLDLRFWVQDSLR